IDQFALRPAAEPGVGELLPREAEAWIALARRRKVGVGNDRVARDVEARAQVVEQADQRVDERRFERALAVVVELDTDRCGIQFIDRAPRTRARLPRAMRIGDELVDG